MKDKLEDLFYDLKDKVEEIIWWIQDNLKMTLIAIVVLISGVVVTMGLLNVGKTDIDKIDFKSKEHLEYLTSNSEMLNKLFLNLDEDSDYMMFGGASNSVLASDNTVSLTYNLYVRKPFTDTDIIETTMMEFLDMIKLQTKSEGKTLRMLNVNLYFRKALYTENVSPSGTFRYMLDYNKLDTKKLQTEMKYANSSVEDMARGETETAKKVKHSEYKPYFNYTGLERDKGTIGLTDEEFEAYLKMDKYTTLAGGFEAGVKLYLQWELGANTRENSYLNISQQFKDFRNRMAELGEPIEYFSDGYNQIVLEERMLRDNPQLLLFVKSDVIENDPTTARKKLLEDYGDEYEVALTRFAEIQGNKYTEFDKVYEPASTKYLNNMTNSQKIANGFVDANGLPLPNSSYDDFFEGNTDEKGKEIKVKE